MSSDPNDGVSGADETNASNEDSGGSDIADNYGSSGGATSGNINDNVDVNNNVTEQPALRIKCVVVGDARVGKTAMIKTAADSTLPQSDYEPTIIDVYGCKLTHPAAYPHTMEIFDSPGEEQYDRLRQLTYDGAHVVVICYSIACRNSYKNAQDRWTDEIRLGLCSKGVPIVLAATKIDLRNQPEMVKKLAREHYAEDQLDQFRLVSKEEGEAMARKIGAYSFVECTSHDRAGVLEVFREALCAALETRDTNENQQMTTERVNLLKKFRNKTTCTIS